MPSQVKPYFIEPPRQFALRWFAEAPSIFPKSTLITSCQPENNNILVKTPPTGFAALRARELLRAPSLPAVCKGHVRPASRQLTDTQIAELDRRTLRFEAQITERGFAVRPA